MMNKRGFSITIPQMITGIVCMFLAMLGIRIVNPFIQVVFNAWDTGINKTMTTIAVYLVIVFILYIIVYGTLMGKTPQIFKDKEENLYQ